MSILFPQLKMAYAKVILNLSNPCNVEYSKSVGVPTSPCVFTETQLTRYADYIKHIANTEAKGRKLLVTVYGDDTLTTLPSLVKFAEQLKDVTRFFKVDIDAPFHQSQLSNIDDLWKVLGKKLKSDIYYGFSFEGESDEERYQYDSLYYNVRWMFTRGIGMGSVIKLNPYNAHRITELFNDFLRLRSELPGLNCIIKLDCGNQYNPAFNESIVEGALQSINAYLTANPATAPYFTYSPNHALRKVRPNTFISNIFCEMTNGGNIYPGYDVQYMTDIARDEFVIGNISEDFTVLNNRRNALLGKLSTERNTANDLQSTIFRSVPWKDDKNVYSIQASEQVCKLHDLLTTYLYEGTFHTNEQS